MDTKINEQLYNDLVKYNASLQNNYANTVLDLAPNTKKYPYTIFSTIRDVANKNYNTCYGRVSSKGYRLDIYAQDKGKVKRNKIAQSICEQLDEFMSAIGLQRVSYNEFDVENEGTVFHIITTYSSDYDEYRKRFI